eukprot:gene10123-13607_t
MNDLFASLTHGIKFNKKKNNSSMDIFKHSAEKSSKLKMDLFGEDRNNVATIPHHSEIEDESAIDISKTITSNKKRKLNEDDLSDSFNNRPDEINAFRNRLQIKVKGEDIPNPCPTFTNMNIHKEYKSIIISNIEKSDWKEPTPIQMQAIPAMLSGRDLLATAPTGSGKTAAFSIPILSQLAKGSNSSKSGSGIRCIILAPTKELAEQISRETTRLITGRRIKICLLKKKLVANMIEKQTKSSFDHFDVLISTPLRFLSLIKAQAIDLSKVQMIVLDEADKLFELDTINNNSNNKQKHSKNVHSNGDIDDSDDGNEEDVRIRSSFLSQIDEILASCPEKGIQRALFSATIGPFVRELAESFLNNPIQVSIGTENTGASTIDQKLVFVGREDGKLLAIRQLVQEGLNPPVLLFLQSIDRAKELFKELIYDGINVDIMHAERTETQRQEVIRRFRIGEIWVLICTDLMARGIDFKGVKMVINYDLPQSAVSYIHRIGRTGRAGQQGKAITFFTEEDMPRIRSIANVIKLSGCFVPDWMLSIKPMNTKMKKQLRRSAPHRRHIDLLLKKTDDEISSKSNSKNLKNKNPTK